ncbi:MAG TPA: amidohydrolase family protein, partial [Gaiellaceae bacterium]|nr:amidohydrolase family protein [Gaiellaceae bacterium]
MPEAYDLVVRGGTIYDGSGEPPYAGDVAIRGDSVTAVGTVDGRAASEIDARGLAIAPGFINMLSWATESLIEDGRSQSDIRQGVTLEVFGEGTSMGPLTDVMRRERLEHQGDIRYEITWTTLAQYLEHVVSRGISCNVGSLIGATSVRVHEIGYDDRPPTADELSRMRELVRAAMRDGALGVGSSLIYAPAVYAKTDELVALCQAAAEYDGLYTSHVRSEMEGGLAAVDEVIEIARRSGVRAEIYHLKQAGRAHWGDLDAEIARIDAARAGGLAVTADMYTYTAGATGLYATMPPWVQEGGHDAWVARLRDPAIRARVVEEMRRPAQGWENFLQAVESPDGILLASFRREALKPLTGKTVGEVARMRGRSAEDTIIDLVIEDDSRVGAIYFTISEDNVRREIALPWMSFGSDAGSLAPEGVFLRSSPHPRAYGNFARLLGRYVRDEKIVPLEEAIRRLTSLPAANLRLDRRGRLARGMHAD